MSKKIISYVVWGDDPVYNVGILRNVEQVPVFYPGWVCRVYCAVDSPCHSDLLKMDCEVHSVEDVWREGGRCCWGNAMRRFWPASEPGVDCVIFRDADSRLSDKEARAVEEWLGTGLALHVMHDDVAHYRFPICAGMWGVRGGWISNIRLMADYWMRARGVSMVCDKALAIDEVFLHEVVWPMFRYGNYCGHGISGAKAWGDNECPFPPHAPLEYGRYIGQVIRADVAPPKVPLFRRRKT